MFRSCVFTARAIPAKKATRKFWTKKIDSLGKKKKIEEKRKEGREWNQVQGGSKGGEPAADPRFSLHLFRPFRRPRCSLEIYPPPPRTHRLNLLIKSHVAVTSFARELRNQLAHRRLEDRSISDCLINSPIGGRRFFTVSCFWVKCWIKILKSNFPLISVYEISFFFYFIIYLIYCNLFYIFVIIILT